MNLEATDFIDKSLSRQENEALHEIQHEILEQLVLGKNHQAILDALCHYAEKLTTNAVASIMLFDDQGQSLQVFAAPSVPQEAIAALNGLVPGPNAGSCGAAVYNAKPQYVCNTFLDSRWQNLKKFAQDFNIRACWSNPIFIDEDKPIGSFALSSFAAREPTEFQKSLLRICAYMASIAIKRQQEQDQLWKLAHYDTLTGLPNRSFFYTHLEQAISIATATHSKLGLLYLDVDKFKDINDTQGHEAGDQVLQYIAKTIQSCLRLGDTFARLGGDEFVILLENVKDHEQINTVCLKICQSILSKYTINGIDFQLALSIGISIFPEHGTSSNWLLRNADTAMYEAKKQAKSGFCFYTEELTTAVNKRLQMCSEIRAALENQEFTVHFQPQYCLTSGNIIGVEALARWLHPTKGLIPPMEFIPVAETYNLINDLGLCILKLACAQCLEWWHLGLPDFKVAVNLSVKQLNPGFSQLLEDELNQLHFPPSRLELEVTESLIMNADNHIELQKLKALGISIAMDDFGMGHSSLAQLKKLPISQLKIDRSFVKDIPFDEDDKIIAATIIAMALNLNLKVVAEGVETEQQRQFFSEKGCHVGQGFLFGKPLPADQFETLLKTLPNDEGL